MRGRQAQGDAALPTYKRVASKDHLHDNLSGRVPGFGKENEKPAWSKAFPHVVVATISSFLFGYHLGVVNDTLESISLDLGFSGNTLAEGLVVSTCLGGAFVGSLFSGSIADYFGRKRSFQLCALPMIVGASMSATTSSLAGMLLGRFLVGTGMGLGPSVAALYVAEVQGILLSNTREIESSCIALNTFQFIQVSPAYVRGTFGSFTQIATCLGLMVSFLIGIPAKETKGWWRVCFWVPVIPAAILALTIELCAESPHWLFKKGRSVEAEAEFERLLGGFHVKSAIGELSKTDRGDEAEAVKFTELFYGRHFKVVFIGSTLFALQQLSGINAVFYFSSTVFKSAGVPSNMANMCVAIVNLSGSCIATVLMDKLGRKVLLLGSFSGMAAALGLEILAASSFVSRGTSVYLSVGGVLLVVLFFALGAGPVPSLLLSEMFPNRIRAKAMAFCMAVHWVINFFVGLLFLRLLEQLGAKLVYTFFATFCLVAFVFVKRNVLETKGKSLQEIELAFLPK